MSKVICDVCGTTYPENATQCPICGCAKPEDAESTGVESTQDVAESGEYTHTKGGRFSKSNVRKRNKNAVVPVPVYDEDDSDDEENDDEEEEEGGKNRGLIIAVILLLLAIVAVGLYIYMRFFAPADDQPKDTQPSGTGTSISTQATDNTTNATEQTEATTVPSTVDTTPLSIPCTSLTLSASTVELTEQDSAWLLNVTAEPANTTDTVTYTTSDPIVATVNSEGRITAVAPGEAVITVTCGSISAQCTVSCNFVIETEPVTEPTTAPTEPEETEPVLALNREDFTLSAPGETWQVYSGKLSKAQINWSSDDESIATVKKGLVTAVGEGWTIIRAEYNGYKASCIVRCTFPEDATQPTEPEATNPGTVEPDEPTTAPTEPEETQPTTEKLTILTNGYAPYSQSEASIAVGDSLTLTLVDSQGKEYNVTWVSSDGEVVKLEGNKITGLKVGNAYLSTAYNGTPYTIKINVQKGNG